MMELGAFTPFLYFARAREHLWDIFEEETGARVTHSFGRVGGMAKPPTRYFKDMVRAAVPRVVEMVTEGEKLVLKNRIFLDRLEGIGEISADEAMELGWTGPALRSTGVPYDVRRAHPYLIYDRLDFDIPVGTNGDNYDRFMVRQEELRQSAKMILQALEQMPDDGPISIEDPRIVLPEKEDVYTTIEATIQHFKIVMEGIKVPAGECYSYTEAGNGELGFYLVSDGTGRPWKCRVRPPCFAATAIVSKLITGLFIADIVPTFGLINMIGGECDR
jgi:NADH-quinone oxidoreductase subunit D